MKLINFLDPREACCRFVCWLGANDNWIEHGGLVQDRAHLKLVSTCSS